MKIRILIPVYRPLPTDGERRAIANNVRQLAAYDVAFVAPEGLDMTPYAALAPEAEVVRVGEEWLGSRNGIAGYNAMMLSERFYRLSEAWDYILICHPDAWIFRDEVAAWAERGYDCVAAPWMRRPVYDLPLVRQYMAWRQRSRHRRGLSCRADLYGRIGNGGLSLRRTAAFIDACRRYADRAAEYLAVRSHLYNEDVFWATVPDNFRYPTPEEALAFAFDTTPAYCPWGATAGRNPACTVSGAASSPEARPLSPSSRFTSGGRFPAAGALLFHQGPPPTLHPLRHAPQDPASRQKGPKQHTGKEISADARGIFCSVTEQSTHPKENFRTQPPSRTEPIFSLPTPEHRKTTSKNYHLPFPPRHAPIFH